jgi:hypothetical protein
MPGSNNKWISIRILIVRTSILVFAFFLTEPCFADATAAWKKILQKCAKSDLIGKQQLFFGFSNAAGPGSIWSLADDGSLRINWELSDLLPEKKLQDAVVLQGKSVHCSGTSTSDWNLSLGLPFSVADTVSAEVSGVLGLASHASVTITGYAIDSVKFGPFMREINDPAKHHNELRVGDLIAANSLKVTGFKAAFSFKRNLSADVQAKFKHKSLTVGAPTSGTEAAHASSDTPDSGAKTGATPNSAPQATKDNDSCDTAPTGDAPAPDSSSNHAGMTGGATLHAGVVSGNQIVVCSQESPYILAAYSRVKPNGELGVGQGAQFTLADVTLPENARPVPYKPAK